MTQKYQRPYNQTLPRTPENVAVAEELARKKAKALGVEYQAKHIVESGPQTAPEPQKPAVSEEPAE